MRKIFGGGAFERGTDLVDRLYLFLVAGMSAGLAAGFLEIVLIWPWHLTKHTRVPYYYLAYLSLAPVIYALCGIFLGLIGILLLRSYRALSGKEPRAVGCSILSGFGFGVLLFLSLVYVFWKYSAGQKGAIVSLMRWPSFLLMAAVSSGLFVVWNRFLLVLLSKGPRFRNAVLLVFLVVTLASSVLLFGDYSGERKETTAASTVRFATGEEPDNLVLVTIDTQRADFMGCYGNGEIRTPAMDWLADGGVLFRYCIAQSPLTLPSHTSILTSTYPVYHGVRTNKGYVVDSSLVTMAEILRDNGYDTAAFVSAFILDDRFGLDQGFNTYDGNFDRLHLYFISKFLNRSLFFRIMQAAGMVGEDPLQRPAAETTSNAVEWIEEHRDEPFFVWIHYFDPHGPWNPIPPYDTMYEEMIDKDLSGEVRVSTLVDEQVFPLSFVERVKANYMGEVSYTDFYINVLRETLVRSGLDRKTLVVITADHGESFSENHFWGHGGVVNDPSIHIPLVFYHPARLPVDVILDGLCESVDIMPTILDFLGIEGPAPMQGRSLLPFMGSSGRLPYHGGYAEAMGSEMEEKRVQSLVTGDWKYIHYPSTDREELISLAMDPAEEEDLAAEYPEVAAKMKAELLELIENISSPEAAGSGEIDAETESGLRALGYVR